MKMVTMSNKCRTLCLLLGLSSVLATLACGAGAGAGAPTPGPQRIVAAFYPFQFVAERVAGPHGQVTSLTQPGAEPHDVELTPRQVASITDADLVVYERGFQADVDKGVAQSGNPAALDTATVVPLRPLSAGNDPAGDGHDPGSSGLDPHVWLDPQNMITIATAVRDQLSAVDATHAADYAANAAALKTELTGLDRAYRTGLADCARSKFVTQHAAFGYLAQRYGLSQIAIAGLSPDTEPSPARIAAVQTEAKKHGVTTIFYETLVSPAVAKSIAGDLGLRTDVLDPIEGITPQSRGSDYLAVMKANLAALQAANGCRT